MKYDLERLRRETIELLTKIERDEAEAKAQERIKTAVDQALAEHEARTRPKPEFYRSEMSALAKSQFIRARIAAGRSSSEAQADYMALPFWRPGSDPTRGRR
jgi:hypothetical protein